MSFVKYGQEWPDGANDVSIELACYLHRVTTEQGGLGELQHFKNAARLLFPDRLPNGRRGHVWNPWTEIRFRCWCNDLPVQQDWIQDYATWWGPSTTGKSADAAVILLTDWLADPEGTTTTVCSTTKGQLLKRIYGEILKFYNIYADQFPGEYSRSKTCIWLGEKKPNAGIFGIAVMTGSIDDAVGNIIGVHNRRNRLVIDEMQATRKAAVEAWDNLSTGEDAKFLGMGNPVSRLDPLGLYSEPEEGWESVHPDKTDMWRSKHGVTVFFDGRKSPAIVEKDGEKKYPFLLKQADHDRTIRTRGKDSPQYWTWRIGFVPPEGLFNTVVTESLIVKYHARSGVEWESGFRTIGGLDPAFATGGDNCVLAPARMGLCIDGIFRILFLDPIYIKLVLSKDTPISYYIAEKVKQHCASLGIAASDLGVDTTGAQSTLADILEREAGLKGLMRIDFGGSPTELPVSIDDPTPAKKMYANRVTELWHSYSEYVRCDQIRGMSDRSAVQFTTRQLKEKLPLQVMTKKEYREEYSESPDEADADVCAIAIVRERHHIGAGGHLVTAGGQAQNDTFREYDLDGDETSYLTPDQ